MEIKCLHKSIHFLNLCSLVKMKIKAGKFQFKNSTYEAQFSLRMAFHETNQILLIFQKEAW